MRQAEIVERLPDVFKVALSGDDPLSALVGVMETLHDHDEQVLAGFGAFVDARRTPDDFVTYLSWWVDMAWLFLDPPDDPYAEPGRPFAGGLGALRELVASAAYESRWRGTAEGMIRRLETATGVQGYQIDEMVTDDAGHVMPFVFHVTIPAAATEFADLVARIVEHEKPAHVLATIGVEDPGQ